MTAPRSDVVARRFKRGESVRQIAQHPDNLCEPGCPVGKLNRPSRADLRAVEDALRRAMLADEGRAKRRSGRRKP